MPKRALIIRHNEFETLGENYTSVLAERGFEIHALNVFEGAPDFTDFNPPPLRRIQLHHRPRRRTLSQRRPSPPSTPRLEVSSPTPWRPMCRFSAYASAPKLWLAHSTALLNQPEVTNSASERSGPPKQVLDDPVFSKLRVALVPTLHGEHFTVPDGATELAFGYMLVPRRHLPRDRA